MVRFSTSRAIAFHSGSAATTAARNRPIVIMKSSGRPSQ
jgi:hypothetical protein